VARLRGTVESSAEQRAAVEIARNTPGVRQFVDQLQIDAGPAGEHAAAS
jgi:osmotically-inducible protein OsmY